VREQVHELEAEGRGPALLIFSNFPFHYLEPGAKAEGHAFMLKGYRNRDSGQRHRSDQRELSRHYRRHEGISKASASGMGIADCSKDIEVKCGMGRRAPC